MRTTRILAAALALPAVTASLLTLATPATAAPTAAQQSLTGYCSQHDDPAPQSSTTSRVALNEPVGPYDRHSGFADAATLTTGSFVKAQRNSSQPNQEDCDTRTSFTNVVRVLPGSSDLAVGTPVVLRAVVDVSAELTSSHDGMQRSTAQSYVSADLFVDDPGATCEEGEWCSPEVVHYRATAQRDLYNMDPVFSETGKQGLYLDVRHSWTAWGSAQSSTGAGDEYSRTLCTTFPCQDAVPGEQSGPTPPLTYAPGQQSVLFHTHVGARLLVRGKLVTSTIADFGSTTATSRTLTPLTASIQQTTTTGLDIVIGDGVVDSVKPVTASTVDVPANAAGWNTDDVTVTITASDAALTGISYVLSGASSGTGSTGTGSMAVPVTEEGITDLSWTAVDASGNTATGTRTIRIDRTAPALHRPTPIARPAGADGTVVVNYAAWATDANGTPSVSCTPASGTAFAVGNTTVQCTSTDVAGNSASGQFLVSVTEPLDVFASIALLRDLVSKNPMDEILRRQLLNDLVLLEKAYEKGRGATKGCKELGDLQLRVTTATTIASGTKQAILYRAGELGELLGC